MGTIILPLPLSDSQDSVYKSDYFSPLWLHLKSVWNLCVFRLVISFKVNNHLLVIFHLSPQGQNTTVTVLSSLILNICMCLGLLSFSPFESILRSAYRWQGSYYMVTESWHVNVHSHFKGLSGRKWTIVSGCDSMQCIYQITKGIILITFDTSIQESFNSF